MKKSDIETRRENGRTVPAINVKYYGRSHVDAVVAKFGCDERTAEQACEYAWESACERFWEYAKERAREIFGPHECKLYSAGRSGGWLILVNLPPVESWDALRVAKFATMARWCVREVKGLTSRDSVLDDIEANEWAKPGAELYNFIEKPDGSHACLADLKAAARDAGFGAAVRP